MNSDTNLPPRSMWPVNILAAMMFLIPAVGVPNEYMLQDTLKSAIAALGILSAVLAFFWESRRVHSTWVWHSMLWVPVALMLYAIGSMAWSHSYLAAVEAVRWFLLSCLMWLALNTLNRNNISRVLWGAHWGIFLASCWVASQYWWDLGLFPQAAAPASTFSNRNFFAEYAISVLPLSVYLLANARAPRWLPALAFTLALNVIAILMTGTRSALLALLIVGTLGMIGLGYYWRQLSCGQWGLMQRWTVLLVLLAGVGTMGCIPSGNTEIGLGRTPFGVSTSRSASIADAAHGRDNSFSTRLEIWKSTARMIYSMPWTGVGAGAWEVQIPLFQPSGTTYETDYYAHNEILQLLAENGGVVGGVALAALLAFLIQCSIALHNDRDKSVAEAITGSSILLSTAAMGIVCLAGFPLRLAASNVLFALNFGYLMVMAGTTHPDYLPKSLRIKPAYACYGVGLSVAALAIASFVVLQAARSEYHYVKTIHQSFYASQAHASQQLDKRDAFLAEARHNLILGLEINPDYRKLASKAADNLAYAGDWRGAVEAWARISDSRPNIPALWSNQAKAYAHLSEIDAAYVALARLTQLRPQAPEIPTIRLGLLLQSGHGHDATKLVHEYVSARTWDFDFLVLGYAAAMKSGDWELAIRVLTLQIQQWPSTASDAYFKLGHLYASPVLNQHQKALEALSTGLHMLPANQRDSYIAQSPRELQVELQQKGR